MEVKDLPDELRGVICAIEYQTIADLVGKAADEIERLRAENEARYGIIELFLSAAGIEPLNGESVPEQIVRAFHRVEEMRKLRYPYPIDLYRDSIRAAEAAKEK